MKPQVFQIGLMLAVMLHENQIRGADPELRALEKEYRAAETQLDLNIQSGKVASYLEQKLARLEQRILDDHRKAEPNETDESKKWRQGILERLKKSSESWKKYRDDHVELMGSLYEGGSIQPQIRHQEQIRLTKERIESLVEISIQGDYDSFKN